MDEEIKRRGDKADIRKPEFVNSIGIASENNPKSFVRIVKINDELTVNYIWSL